MDMLTQEDLKQIGGVIDEKLVGFEKKMDEKLDKKFDEKFVKFEARIVPEIVRQVSEKVVADVGEMIEENVLPGFDRLENTLVSKDYLDDKLADLRRAKKKTPLR